MKPSTKFKSHHVKWLLAHMANREAISLISLFTKAERRWRMMEEDEKGGWERVSSWKLPAVVSARLVGAIATRPAGKKQTWKETNKNIKNVYFSHIVKPEWNIMRKRSACDSFSLQPYEPKATQLRFKYDRNKKQNKGKKEMWLFASFITRGAACAQPSLVVAETTRNWQDKKENCPGWQNNCLGI